jgi:membrane protein YqaA with SNARE-associated domain
VEVSTQNQLIAMAIIGLTLDSNPAMRDQAYVVPLVYGACAATGNVLWAIVAWKLGLTLLDRHATIREACQQLNSARRTKKRQGWQASQGPTEMAVVADA